MFRSLIACSFVTFLALTPLSSVAQPLVYSQFRALSSPGDGFGDRFGTAVTFVGDVNGDNVPDFAASAAGDDRAYVINGDDLSVLYELIPPAEGPTDGFGNTLAGVGDIDGDEVGDIAAGASEHLYVLSGANGTLIHSIEAPDVPSSGFGSSIVDIGDIDGDGVPDLAVGAPYARIDSKAAGRVHVVSGATGLEVFTLTSPDSTYVGFGWSLTVMDDLDGDGHSELIVGAPFETSDLGLVSGAVYIFDGVDGALVRVIYSPRAETFGQYGSSVAPVEDLDGDGLADLIVGAPGESVNDESEAGRAYVVATSTWDVLHEMTSPIPDRRNDFGSSVLALGDVDGDGASEIAVAEPEGERVYVLSGATGRPLKTLASVFLRSGFGASISGSDLGGDNGPGLLVGAPEVRANGFNDVGSTYVVSFHDADRGDYVVLTSPLAQPYGEAGAAGAFLSDVDGGGQTDLLFSAPRERRVYVVSSERASVIYSVVPPDDYAGFGRDAAAVCDVNGDGQTDFIVGAVDSNFFAAGRAYLFSGYDGALLYALDSPNTSEGGAFGASVASLADVDGDDVCEVIVGAPRETGPVPQSGRAYVFSGSKGALLHVLDTPSPDPSSEFGYDVSGVGDINGGGKADIVVGARSDEGASGDPEGGRAYIFDGSTGALIHTLIRPPPSDPFDFFGAAVSEIGDVNGDGWPDVAVGSNKALAGPTGPAGAGKVYIFSGLDGTLIHNLASPNAQSDGRYGWDVVGVGDLDGDGSADFAVGAPYEFGTGTPGAGEGRVYVHSGSDGAVLGTVASPLEAGGTGSGAFGQRMAVSASDSPTLLVGAPYENEGNVSASGRAYAFELSTLVPTPIRGSDPAEPESTVLLSAYPNPANGRLRVAFSLPAPGLATLRLVDLLGRVVATQHAAWSGTGVHEVTIETGGLSAGVYLLQLEAGDRTSVQRVVIY